MRTFDINDHLKHFFDDPFSFQVVQARTNAIVGGSNALQFFDRNRYPHSDLDVYVSGTASTIEVVDYLQGCGYEFSPTDGQLRNGSFSNYLARVAGFSLEDGYVDTSVSKWHRWSDIRAYGRGVLNFFKAARFAVEGPDHRLHVQIICGSNCPVEAVLSYHSSECCDPALWEPA